MCVTSMPGMVNVRKARKGLCCGNTKYGNAPLSCVLLHLLSKWCVRMHLLVLCACGLFFDDCGCPEYLCVKCAGATSWRCRAFSASAARHRAAANTALVNGGKGSCQWNPPYLPAAFRPMVGMACW